MERRGNIMVLDIECVTKMFLGTTPETRILSVNGPMIGACCAYWKLCKESGVSGVMTGAAREKVYAREPLHLNGLAWDFRSSIFPDPEMALERLRNLLLETYPHYRVVYIKPPKTPHFHVEARGWGVAANERGP